MKNTKVARIIDISHLTTDVDDRRLISKIIVLTDGAIKCLERCDNSWQIVNPQSYLGLLVTNYLTKEAL